MHVAHFLPKFLPITEAWLGDTFTSLKKLKVVQSFYTLATIPNINYSVPSGDYFCYHDQGIVRKSVYRLKGLFTGKDPSSLYWFSELSHRKPDVIHVHFAHLAGRVFPLAQKLKIPAVISVYGTDILQYTTKDKFPKFVYESFMQYRYILCTSTYLKTHLIKLGIPEQKIIVWYLGVDTTVFTLGNLPDAQKNIDVLCNARFVWFKGHTHLLKAIPGLLHTYPDLQVWLIGDGPFKNDIIREIHTLGISRHVRLIGTKPHSDIPQLLQQTKIYIQPSTADRFKEEALGMALVEACACGIPVIGTRSGGIPEVISHNKNGFLTPDRNPEALARAIRTLLSNKVKRQKFGRESRNMAVSRFNLPKQAHALKDIYTKISNRTYATCHCEERSDAAISYSAT